MYTNIIIHNKLTAQTHFSVEHTIATFDCDSILPPIKNKLYIYFFYFRRLLLPFLLFKGVTQVVNEIVQYYIFVLVKDFVPSTFKQQPLTNIIDSQIL